MSQSRNRVRHFVGNSKNRVEGRIYSMRPFPSVVETTASFPIACPEQESRRWFLWPESNSYHLWRHKEPCDRRRSWALTTHHRPKVPIAVHLSYSCLQRAARPEWCRFSILVCLLRHRARQRFRGMCSTDNRTMIRCLLPKKRRARTVFRCKGEGRR